MTFNVDVKYFQDIGMGEKNNGIRFTAFSKEPSQM